MSTEPEETSEENPERKNKIERVPEGTFGGIRSKEMNPYQTIQEIKDRARIEGAETIVADSCLHRLARFSAFRNA